ncbi:matrin 3-like 1.2 isoform X1 [Takifugu flavidus]|uniref:matrin 3-like 1.2 isoform X1 n=1 Tax=Takifugu flavidus TaxID=433684 RepID=UPI002544146E|nr:matrin 3-like 1.2 isoform X1 [Takifugu flavidus]
MSQKSQSDTGQKHFAVGRGLLAAAETLNFNLNEQRPGRPMGGVSSGVGGGGGMEGPEGSPQMSRHGSSGSHLGNTMKLFASLGLSPSDLDALAEIPEEDISVETLPQILMQLKSRKTEAAERRSMTTMSSDAAFRGGSWTDVQTGRMGSSSLGLGSARPQPSVDFGFGSLQDMGQNRGFNFNYASGGGGGGASRDRSYSELSHHDSYTGLDMGPSTSDPVFMQRRIGSPSNGKVQDFLGVTPTMFPHVCSLCDFDVHSILEWNQHISGLQHAERRRLLLNMYPDWDPGMPSSRGGGLMNTPNLSAGLLGPVPGASVQVGGGLAPGWGGGSVQSANKLGPNQPRSRVVVVKYDRKPLSNKTLFAFTKPFGVLREHLVLKNKAFLEMSSHEEAADMVNYHKENPASLYGKPLSFYLSKTLLVIEKDLHSTNRQERTNEQVMERHSREDSIQHSQVVFFSNLPREEDKKKELLTIAGRFGVVEKHLFLTDQAFVQLGTPQDAKMMVKYYTMNPLTIKGRKIRLNICAKYKTLDTSRRLERSERSYGVGGSSTRTTSGSLRTSSSSSKIKEKKKKKEEEDKGKESPKSEEKVEDEEVSEVLEKDEEASAEKKLVTNGDAEGEELKKAETMEEEVKQEVPGAPGGVATAAAVDPGDRPEAKDGEDQRNKADPKESAEAEDVLGDVNMEDFVTLDELAEDEDEAEQAAESIDSSKRGVSMEVTPGQRGHACVTCGWRDASVCLQGMRVVNIVGFRRGYNFLNELLALAKPFGKVVKHLVLDLRAEAYLQFETEEQAKTMARFYNTNVTASVCGRPVRISHSTSYPTIQCGSSKVVYVGNIPSSSFSDESILKLAEPFGKVCKYFTNRIKREAFIEMENAEDAEKMGEYCKEKSLKFNGNRLMVYVSRKYRQLKHGHRFPNTAKRDSCEASPVSSRHPEEPPAKKPREEEEQKLQEEEEKVQEEEEQKLQEEEEKVQEEEEQKLQEEEKVQEEEEQKLQEEEEKVQEEEEEQELQEQELQEEELQEEDLQELQEEDLQELQEQEEQSCTDKKEGETTAKFPDVSKPTSSQNEVTQEVNQEVQLKDNNTLTNQKGHVETQQTDLKPSVASLPLPPFDPNKPIGVEHVTLGYYCRVCLVFYSNEDAAKKTHCSSQTHYEKLQKHLEKEKSKSEKIVKQVTA